MSNKMNKLFLGLTVLMLALSAVNLILLLQPRGEAPAGDVQYVLYLGTDTSVPGMETPTREEALARAREILSRHVEGWTIQEASGGWTDENGALCTEYTLVISLSDIDSAKAHETAEALRTAFGQTSVLIQTNRTVTEFYSGGK